MQVNSSHLNVECEKLENGNSGMMIHVLEGRKSYFTLLGHQETPKDCEALKAKVDRLRTRNRMLNVLASGTLSQHKTQSEWTWAFDGLGRFPGDSRVLGFVGVSGADGECIGAKADGSWCS